MKQEEIAELLSALRGGLIQCLVKEGKGVQMEVVLPELAAQRGENFTLFYCTLGDCQEFFLQPFRNESTIISELKIIEQLEMHLGMAEVAAGGKVKVAASHQIADEGACLSIKAATFNVYDEAFDGLSAQQLEDLRPETGLRPVPEK